jgi:hypothetical protein
VTGPDRSALVPSKRAPGHARRPGCTTCIERRIYGALASHAGGLRRADHRRSSAFLADVRAGNPRSQLTHRHGGAVRSHGQTLPRSRLHNGRMPGSWLVSWNPWRSPFNSADAPCLRPARRASCGPLPRGPPVHHCVGPIHVVRSDPPPGMAMATMPGRRALDLRRRRLPTMSSPAVSETSLSNSTSARPCHDTTGLDASSMPATPDGCVGGLCRHSARAADGVWHPRVQNRMTSRPPSPTPGSSPRSRPVHRHRHYDARQHRSSSRS